jgi:hypothetical protein
MALPRGLAFRPRWHIEDDAYRELKEGWMVIMSGVPGFSLQGALMGDRPEPADRSICSRQKSQHSKHSETVFLQVIRSESHPPIS